MTQKDDAERAAFEKWALTDEGNCYNKDIRRSTRDNEYLNPLVERDWEVWKARAALDASAELVGKNSAVWHSNLQRTRDQWVRCDPDAMSKTSQAAIYHALNDAKRDVLMMHALLTRPDADKRDAERYRWLRDEGEAQWNVVRQHAGEYLDAAIDAALSQASKGNGNEA